MQVVYVGLKEIKADNIAQTGLIWKRGEVHDVADEKKAAKLLEHPLIWQDVSGKKSEEIEALLLPEFVAVAPEPRVSFVQESGDSPFWDPHVVVVPEEILKKLQSKELEAYFLTPEDADLFSLWKKELTKETAPKRTGPRAQQKETKPGLDTKAGLEAKKAA